MLKPSHHISQSPPTSAKGSDNITISVSVRRPKFRNSSRKMIIRVTGTTILSLAVARSRYSNWPLHCTVVPGGKWTVSATAFRALAT